MESDSENESPELTALNIVEAPVKVTSLSSLPEMTRKKYETAYTLFMAWREKKGKTSFSENVLLSYFVEISQKYKATTLWTMYSMLRTLIMINGNVDIGQYQKLKAFLKRESDSHQPKKSKTFTSFEINKFIREAPDEKFLLAKVALIMGIMGACRRNELRQMRTTHLNDLGSAVLVTIPDTDTKTKVVRKFTITGHFYEIYRKYADLRPPNVYDPYFFLNYQKGKCTVQKVGINKFGAMGKQIAKYLKLPNPESYTGHCFRRSSALVDVNGDIVTSLNRQGGWRSATVAKGYIGASADIFDENNLDLAPNLHFSNFSLSSLQSTELMDLMPHTRTETQSNMGQSHEFITTMPANPIRVEEHNNLDNTTQPSTWQCRNNSSDVPSTSAASFNASTSASAPQHTKYFLPIDLESEDALSIHDSPSPVTLDGTTSDNKESENLAENVVEPPKKKKKHNSMPNLERALHTLKEISKMQKFEKPKRCEYSLFGKLVGSQLKKLPEALALETMQNIQTYLVKQRLKSVKSDNGLGMGNSNLH